jgi:hypothetical protein
MRLIFRVCIAPGLTFLSRNNKIIHRVFRYRSEAPFCHQRVCDRVRS